MSIFDDVLEVCTVARPDKQYAVLRYGMPAALALDLGDGAPAKAYGVIVTSDWQTAQRVATTHYDLGSRGVRVTDLRDLRTFGEVVVFDTAAVRALANEAVMVDSARQQLVRDLRIMAEERDDLRREVASLRETIADLTAQIDRPGVADEVSDG